MRLRFGFIFTLGFTLGVGVLPAAAQFSDAQIVALVEALGKTKLSPDQQAAHTEWQAQNIPLWSQKCIGRSLTANQFSASPVTARWISVCTVRDALQGQLQASGNNTAIAVRRTAAWWVNGKPDRYNSRDTAPYTQAVLRLYQQQQPASATSASRPPTKSPPSTGQAVIVATTGSQPTAQPALAQATQTPPAKPPAEAPSPTKPPATDSAPGADGKQPAATSSDATSSLYDRYMKAGYAATQQRNNPQALVYFKRALDERPDDSYAKQAIANVESYLKQPSTSSGATNADAPKPVASPPAAAPQSNRPGTAGQPSAKPTTPPKKPKAPTSTRLTPPPKTPTASATTAAPAPTATVIVSAEPPAATLTEQQAIALITRWLQAKVDIFAPPFDQQQVVDLTTGELLASLVKPDGVLTWLKTNRAYYRYGVQKVESVERFVVARDRATIELKLVEDRTLYFNGAIDPNRTDFSTQQVRFTLELVDGTWKIADYKTVEGFLLERAVLQATNSAVP